ncbi:hypothetical protein DSECCO2_310060 [anaerobic digester metagenome]
MEIKPHQITIKQLFEDYTDMGEEGVFGFNGKLNIRPPYQRELVYDASEQAEVIASVRKGFPINVMYWMDNENGTFELLDGQQRTLSICRFIDGEFPLDIDGNPKFYDNLTEDQQNKILNYELTIYYCIGSDTERLDWFRIINIAGKKLTDQELRNAVYNGAWVTAAKKIFSKTNCYAYNLGGNYIRGDSIRQEIFETVLLWACNKDNIATIEKYMALHQHDSDAKKLKEYFTSIIDWIEKVFPEYHPKMKGLPWGLYFNKYYNRIYDITEVKNRVHELMDDPEVTRYAGVFEYILGGEKDVRLLSLRQFDEPTKRAKYKQQNGICPMCGESFAYNEMHGDHIKPWAKNGTTTIENCQMLCARCNLIKGATEANF